MNQRLCNTMKNELIFCTISLHNMAGGLERNLITITNFLAKAGYKVSIITFDWENAQSFYNISEGIVWHKVATSNPHTSISFIKRAELLLKIRRIVKTKNNPIIVCFHHGIVLRFLLATIGLSRKIIVSERNSLSLYKHIKATKWNINFLALIFVNKITVQFESYSKDYPWWLYKKIVVLPNSIFSLNSQKKSTKQDFKKNNTILTIGRFSAQKQVTDIIIAFSYISQKFPDWDLKIVGQGENKESIEREIASLNLGKQVSIIPPTNNIMEIYNGAEIFCSTSQWEGFPNVVAEAMSFKLPVIGYSDCAGVNELVRHGITGFLVKRDKKHQELSKSLEKLMFSEALRKQLGRNAREEILAYSPKKVLAKWFSLVNF